ncbi:MAG: hypothetical protein QOF49_1162 [Chloroflexota bacterium]|nr:hypothetical protein [Chloroflexota bacterium]
MWQMPLSSADPAPALPPVQRWARRLRYVGEPRHRTLILDRAWPSPAVFWSVARGMLATQSEPYLAIAVRSDISLSPRFAEVEAILRELPTSAGFIFETPEVAVARLATAQRRPLDVGQRPSLPAPD